MCKGRWELSDKFAQVRQSVFQLIEPLLDLPPLSLSHGSGSHEMYDGIVSLPCVSSIARPLLRITRSLPGDQRKRPGDVEFDINQVNLALVEFGLERAQFRRIGDRSQAMRASLCDA